MLNFFGAVSAGTVRTGLCPYCGRRPTVACQPLPLRATRRHRPRVVHVTKRGVAAGRVG